MDCLLSSNAATMTPIGNGSKALPITIMTSTSAKNNAASQAALSPGIQTQNGLQSSVSVAHSSQSKETTPVDCDSVAQYQTDAKLPPYAVAVNQSSTAVQPITLHIPKLATVGMKNSSSTIRTSIKINGHRQTSCVNHSDPTKVNVTKSSRVDPTEVNVAKSSRVDPTEVNFTKSSRVDPTKVNVAKSSRVDPTKVNVAKSSRVDPTEVDVAKSSRVDPTEVDVTKSSRVDPTKVNVVKSSRVHPTEVNVAKSSRVHPTEVNVVKSSRVDSSEVNVVKSSRVDSSEVNVVKSSRVDSSEAKEANETAAEVESENDDELEYEVNQYAIEEIDSRAIVVINQPPNAKDLLQKVTSNPLVLGLILLILGITLFCILGEGEISLVWTLSAVSMASLAVFSQMKM